MKYGRYHGEHTTIREVYVHLALYIRSVAFMSFASKSYRLEMIGRNERGVYINTDNNTMLRYSDPSSASYSLRSSSHRS